MSIRVIAPWVQVANCFLIIDASEFRIGVLLYVYVVSDLTNTQILYQLIGIIELTNIRSQL